MFQEKEQFQARSGRIVKVGEDGSLIFDHVNGYLGPDSVFDAEEYFQAKRDADLEVFRSTTDPHLVVREIDRDVFGRRRVGVLDERTFEVRDVNDVVCGGDYPEHRAAREYFEAHPERKPWADAKPGEVWILTHVKGEEGAFIVNRDRFESPSWSLTIKAESITGGRRVWPEDAS